MKKRSLCASLPEVSILGFGCMRFYREDGSLDMMSTEKPIDEKLSRYLIDQAIERGVNYFDTAYTYLGGMSELLLGKHFYQGKREKVLIATKLPTWLMQKPEDFETYLNDQLKRLKTDRIDCYLLHSLNGPMWRKVFELGVLPFLQKAKESGKVRAVGFSFHDLFCEFEPILEAFDWDFCQLQMNYLDTEYQAGLKGIKKAKEKGMGVIAMEPLLGGKLATQLPLQAKQIIDQAEPKRSPAEWALRWVWNMPEISLLLSGMNAQDQLDENCRIADDVMPSLMTKQELEVIEKVKSLFQERIRIHCAACAYCMPCPSGVAIPLVFSTYNEAFRFDDPTPLIRYYKGLPEEIKASRCIECGQCESKCPHQLLIRKYLQEARDYFEPMDQKSS